MSGYIQCWHITWYMYQIHWEPSHVADNVLIGDLLYVCDFVSCQSLTRLEPEPVYHMVHVSADFGGGYFVHSDRLFPTGPGSFPQTCMTPYLSLGTHPPLDPLSVAECVLAYYMRRSAMHTCIVVSVPHSYLWLVQAMLNGWHLDYYCHGINSALRIHVHWLEPDNVKWAASLVSLQESEIHMTVHSNRSSHNIRQACVFRATYYELP